MLRCCHSHLVMMVHNWQLFLLRAAGFLLPFYIMAWAISILQRRRQRQVQYAISNMNICIFFFFLRYFEHLETLATILQIYRSWVDPLVNELFETLTLSSHTRLQIHDQELSYATHLFSWLLLSNSLNMIETCVWLVTCAIEYVGNKFDKNSVL